MKKLLALLFLLPLMAQAASFTHPFTKGDNSVTMQINDMKITVEVLCDEIIHVNKAPTYKQDYLVPELVVELKAQKTDWEIAQTAKKLTIKTPKIKLEIDENGVIEYYTDKGKALLSETKEDTYIDLKKSRGNVISQGFTSGDEAIYGLGQMQSGIMNWKNVPATLIQYNQEAIVPFIVSTKGYGLLWNNYSVTDFNPAEKEIAFSLEVFEDTVAKTIGKNDEPENVANTRYAKNDKKNIRETKFTPAKTGRYTFYVECDTVHKGKGVVSVSFDKDTVINYTTMWLPKNFSGEKYLEAGKEYTVVFENTGSTIPGRLLYNEPDYDKTVFASRAATSIDYYVVVGENPAQVVELNHKLTGQTPMFSKKTYGFWQCRERYHSQEELMENAREMRERKVPYDMIVQDWLYWPSGTKGPEWDRARYPDPKAMASELKDMNVELMVSVWPMINNRPMLAHYKMNDYKLAGTQYFDFWDKKKGDGFYQILSDSMFKLGVNSIWLDGSEPGTVPKDNITTAAGLYKYVANSFSLVVSKSMYENKRIEYPRERVVNLTRSAFSGQQRYGVVTWSGDVAGDWEQFGEQISAGLNFTMSGVPYWSHDIGGFFRPRDQMKNKNYLELYARWFQFGAFSPIFRIHGFKSETEIWRWGTEFETMARKFIDLRYSLMPYIYSQAWQVTQRGLVLMSPLANYYPEDKNTWAIDDQLFFGENMMVALVTEYGAREKQVYLPKGEWIDFWTGDKYSGEKTITLPAPVDSTPILVKAGSIIPFGPKVQYATEPTDVPTRIKVYSGADGQFTLYLDDNTSYDYEKGKYSEVKLSYSEASKTLTIEQGAGNFINFAKLPQTFTIEMNGKTKDVVFKGKVLKIKL